MRPRNLLILLAAVVVVALVMLSFLDQLLVDYLWYGRLGYGGVFNTTVGAEIAIFLVVWLVAFAAIFVSGLIAIGGSRNHERLRVVRRPDEMVEVNLPELIRALGERVPWRVIVAAGAALLALFAAQGEATSWDTYLKGLYGVPFGIVEQAFGNDIGFYVFTVPLLEEIRDLFLMVIVLAAGMAIAVYWARGALDFKETPPRVSPGATGHLSVLLGLFFIQRAMSYWLGRFDLLLHTDGVVFGLRYVDRILWQPGLWLLVALSLAAAVMCIYNAREGGLRLPVAAFVIVFGPALIMNFIQPVIERLWVKPDELRVEKPYLERNIEATRHAYKLDTVDVKPFAGQGTLTPAALGQDEATVKNIRLWDPRPLIDTYRQLQEIRTYYDFRDVDIDRYWIEGKYTEVMLSPREMNIDQLPDTAQTWVNQHLKFTHGAGLAMSPVNKKDTEGLPVFYVKDIPAVSSVGLKVEQPAIYFGEARDNYAVVDSATPEFDYPKGADNVFSYYSGSGGVPVAGFFRRLLFSIFFRDINLLVTENIVAKSKIMIRRNIASRIAYIAPFLNLDRDPYAVVLNGRMVWIVDCYTTSDHYPYSQRNADGINYIRNSVKVVVDAYTGDTDFYVADPEDPIIKTWQRVFPEMFKPMAAMPTELRAHIRYPEDFFLIQADTFRTYHMTDPQVFYNREDLWGFPRENYAGQTVPMSPYYVIMRLPGEAQAEYMLMLPMVPSGRDNMIAWMAARCDGADYGHLFEYSFSKDRLFYGPYQIQARINQNPEISRQLSLWNQMGSKVILGNLLVIPVQDSLLYVEPLFIRAENGQLPELQRVVASYSDRVVMGDTLDLTLAALFTNEAPPAPTIAKAIANETAPQSIAQGTVPGKADMQSAAQHYNRAMDAIRAGDWTAFGTEMKALGDELSKPSASGHP
ncbi:MAG TPA: UPF0182 family protein [Candidatus Binatus sp.]|uniref:UPF0182 family membrane protein n=1 Tax=Candidatus Binatus sp. TaxID=2811406 RepID=UPI002B477DA2|nr:UPF0182 family protein [Candidatus Binatus sp.]HKN14994.1 UPF0182 family protein [Candidatus Binatus sp.]